LRPFKFDRSGLTLIASGPELNQYYIQSVRENSPAEAAGAQPGDRIRWAQRWPARFWSLEGLVKLLKKREGKTIRLSVQRGDEKVRLKFELKKLI
jgi:C-terminal processing protease CtpA/Prc